MDMMNAFKSVMREIFTLLLKISIIIALVFVGIWFFRQGFSVIESMQKSGVTVR